MENIENEIKWLEEIDLESEMKAIRKFERRKIRTAVIIGRSGNGKSVTGNSILGRRAFVSRSSFAGVTNTCKLHSTELEDGKIINIIDTPGMFDFSDPATIAKEIGKSVVLARHGIHAVVLVLSIQSRFTREEACAVENLKELFGSEVHRYTIIIFTGGDALEDQGITLNDYLGSLCPQPLKDVLELCGNRYMLFDNMTKDEVKKKKQVTDFLSIVETVVENNGGKPFTNELFPEQMEAVNYNAEDIAQLREKQFRKATSEALKKLIQITNAAVAELDKIHKRDEERRQMLAAENGGLCQIL
ncbi:hypothetical protein ACP275_03G126600 [Erythranthe tilingii]